MTQDTPATVDAPIVAVTVFPDRARVTRRGRITLGAGEQQVAFDQLPLTLHPDSVRVAGAGAASVLGVDVALRHPARSGVSAVRALEEQLRSARTALQEIDDRDAILADRLAVVAGIAHGTTRTWARTLTTAEGDPARVSQLCDALDAQQEAVRGQRRELAQRRQEAADHVAACERELAARRGPGQPDHYRVLVTLGVAEPGEVTIELAYLVDRASWRSAYDVRLADDELTLSWFGLVSQTTGEDWPECELRLSTARPSHAVAVPELKPWFLDRLAPPVPLMPAARSLGKAADSQGPTGYSAQVMPMAAAAPLEESVAVREEGATAATYRPERVVAVPADGNAHRTTVAVERFATRRDYVTAPVLAEEAHLRAKVINTSAHTLPGGTAAVFHGPDFVGSTVLDVWAPGEEIELALGVDDRVRVERELVRRTAAKAVLGGTRRRETEHRITVTNHTPNQATITVLDQTPVSRDDAITVKEVGIDPTPTERYDLGVLSWVLELAPGETRELHLGIRVEVARGVQLLGWRE